MLRCFVKFSLMAVMTLVLMTPLSNNFALADSCTTDCSFVLLSPGNNKRIVVNQPRAQQRLPPFSTFKIAHSLVLLELGIVNSGDKYFAVNLSNYPEQAWWPKAWLGKNMSLRDIFQFSVAPVYQSLAQDVGAQRMQDFVNAFDYGNKDISSGQDSFWLGESLQISAVEQVQFLRKLYRNKLKLKAKTLKDFWPVMLVEDINSSKIYAKTGAGYTEDKKALGWYVGIVVDKKGPHYFALNLKADSFAAINERRKVLAMQLLREHGVL